MDWLSVLKSLAPTVASALGGPLAGSAVIAIGELLGVSEPTKAKIEEAFINGQLTGEQIAGLKQLEMKLKAEEQDRGFKYAELEYKDRADARNMAVQTGAKTPAVLTWLIVAIVLGLEGYILFEGTPERVSEIVMGRILGTLDMCLITVLSYWFGTTYGSSRKTDMLAGGK